MIKLFATFSLALLLFFNIKQQRYTTTDQLIVFTNTTNPILSDQDIKNLESLAKEADVQLKIIDIQQQGAPKEITYTPTLVFQNYLGRSFYYGRYTNKSRLHNFMRISRLAHQQDAENIKNDLLSWQDGRSTVIAPLKITALKGAPPTDFDPDEFMLMAKKAIQDGMSNFKLKEKMPITRTTRSFYCNFYPYLDNGGRLTISAEIFSQYNCIQPIFQKYNDGLVKGKWEDRAALFAKAGEMMEAEMVNQIKNSTNGDAFQFIPQTIQIKDWDELQLSLPFKPLAESDTQIQAIELPKKWKVAPHKSTKEPIAIFSFPSPLDGYAGEIKALSGTLEIAENNSLQNTIGDFEVNISDITMGAEDFDAAVQNKMLKKALFPSSTFHFDQITDDVQPLKIGRVTTFEVTGTFTLLGISKKVDVVANIEPVFVAEELQLQVNASFQIPLKKQFGVDGPDGPSPAKDILQFYMKFFMEAG